MTTNTCLFDTGIRPPPILLLENPTMTPLLPPSYKQRLKREILRVRSEQHWSDQSEFMLQDYFDHVDAAGDNVNEYANAVTGFIKKCIDDVIPIVSFKTNPIQNVD